MYALDPVPSPLRKGAKRNAPRNEVPSAIFTLLEGPGVMSDNSIPDFVDFLNYFR